MPSNTIADLVVLGAGSGGYAAALRGAQLGLRVVLVESDLVGGTCLHRGCIPTKAILHAAHVADAARSASSVGVQASFEGVDMPAVNAFADKVVSRLHKGLSGLIDQRGIEVVNGFGRLVVDEQSPGVAVGDHLIRGRNVILATGSRSKTMGLPIDGEKVITSEHALKLQTLPSSVIVLGGGVIGCEFASAWRSFGVEVTIVEALDRLVPNEEPSISKDLTRAFTKRKIKVKTGLPVVDVQAGDEGVDVDLEGGERLSAELLLVAVGREAVTDRMGFEEAGVELERGCVKVDENLATTVPGVFAVGDLVAGLQLAHRGFAHGIFAAERIAHLHGKHPARPRLIEDVAIPKVTYCDPEIASVGLTSEQAAKHGEIAVAKYNLAGNGRSQILGTDGSITVIRIVDGPVVGVHMIGSGVSELIGEAQVITAWEGHPEDLAGHLHAHPTQNEALGEAFMALAGQPLHVHG